MRYLNRADVERTGRGGCVSIIDEKGSRARVLGSFWLYVDPKDQGFTPHMIDSHDGFWEAWITYWMSAHVEPGWRCLDVGANVGYYTLFLLDHGCRVRSFEPQPHLADLLERSVEENHLDFRFEGVETIALSVDEGVQEMVVPRGHGMNGSIVRNDTKNCSRISVRTSTLDAFADVPCDFLKVDVEGAEDRLFRGASRFIEKNPDCLWLLEWRWDRIWDPGQSAREIFERMTVSWIDYQGAELPLDRAEQLADRQHEDWMLVLRAK